MEGPLINMADVEPTSYIFEDQRSDPLAVAAEKTVYLAVGQQPRESEPVLLWAIQNFSGWKICILHVHQPADLTSLLDDMLEAEGVGAYRQMERKIMEKNLDDYLHLCNDLGVKAEKVHIEMDSAEAGILDLIKMYKIKRLIMRVDKNFNILGSKSRKAKHVELLAPRFCTIYFVCNGNVISKREAEIVGPSIQNDQPASSMGRQTVDIEAASKVMVLEKLYGEELRKRKVIEEELKKMKIDNEKVIIEARDQKASLELKISVMQQCLEDHSGLLKLREEQIDNLQAQLDDAAQIVEELSNQSPDARPSAESTKFSTLSYSDIVEATSGLDPSMLLRETEHGNIFKGLVSNTPVTMRLLFADGLFKKEVEALSKFRHPNLGNMVGACQDASAIVYEHLSNGSLEERLACTDQTPPLSWQGRIRIALELCSALIFLHESRPCSMIHCALRPSCILLDSHFTCKLIGFDFSHIILHGEDPSSSTSSTYATSIYTSSYTDPEFLETREVSPKCDVYSFGIILLELLTGIPAMCCYLVDEIQRALDEDQFCTLLDSSAGVWPILQAQQLVQVGLRCCDPSSSMRPDLKLEVWRVIEPMGASCGSALTFMSSDPPSYFLCPISYEVMRDPQVAADGHTYEAEVLKQWIDSGHNTSPMTNLPFENNNLTPNLPLRSAVQEWLQHQSS